MKEKKNKREAIYAGSFDPITKGHLWVMVRALTLFDNVIIAIAKNATKEYTFTFKERMEMIKNSLKDEYHKFKNYHVDNIGNKLLVNYADEKKIDFLVRGIRNLNDYVSEDGMRHVNHDICNYIIPIYVIPPPELSQISSSLVKGLIGSDGWQREVERYVPEPVYKFLLKKYG